jgi:S-DNA-T family DNA segregation ATPase FtsK/SpoIIIE
MILESAAVKLALAGGALGASYWAWISRPEVKFRRTLEQIIVANNIYDEERRPDGKRFRSYPKVAYVYELWNGYTASVHLPVNISPSEFRKYKEVFEMVTKSEVEMEFEGPVCHMSFYQMPLHKVMNFNEKILHELSKRDLSVVVGFSRRGMEVIEFGGEAGAHVLVAGATEMGKSILLRVIVTSLLWKYGRNINMVLINHKINDNWPFMNIPNVEIEESAQGAILALEDAIKTIAVRKRQLVDKGYIDAKEWNANEPEKMNPYFIVIDEAARFSDNKSFEKLVVEIAETGRFVEMHLIIATQRPDGRDVISPRIKDNCLTKIAFRTGTKGGSETILGDPAACNLPLIPGRAILYVNKFRTIQVPFMSKEQCLELIGHLKEGKRTNADRQGSRYLGEFTEVRSHEPGPHSEDSLPRRGKTGGNRK